MEEHPVLNTLGELLAHMKHQPQYQPCEGPPKPSLQNHGASCRTPSPSTAQRSKICIDPPTSLSVERVEGQLIIQSNSNQHSAINNSIQLPIHQPTASRPPDPQPPRCSASKPPASSTSCCRAHSQPLKLVQHPGIPHHQIIMASSFREVGGRGGSL